MAIDSVLYPPADDLALPDKNFYPLKIPVSHWQLRHYISHPDPDVLYYASGTDVFYLNTVTRKRKHIATLPFEARCTASGFGYVCVGGEDYGRFAVIKLEEERHLDLDTADDVRPIPTAVDVRVEKIGEHIVNSISIHRIHDEDAHLYDIVAVLTNNDNTVRIYSLSHNKEADVIELTDPMNHATISPNGKALAAVGDVNTVFFFARYEVVDPPQIPKPHNRLNMAMVHWRLVGQYSLYVPGPHTQKGYFTTAWSPRGHLLAVGSEAGYITVFDMENFEDTVAASDGDIEAARLVTIPSSRPDVQALSCPGAVRSMLFAPDPWELLIWAEDQGRICIGDLRTALNSKQVVDLDPKDKTLHVYEFDDIETPSDLLEARDLPTLSSEDQTQREGQDTDRSRISDNNGLTADEQRILESLRTTRQREEARSNGAVPRSVNYTSASMFDRAVTPSSAPASNHALQDYQMQMLLLEARRLSRERGTQGNTEAAPTPHEYMLPPLQASQSRSPTSNDQSTLPPYARRAGQETSPRREDDGPWRIISDAMSLARGPLFESPANDQARARRQQQDRLRTLQRNLDSPPWESMATGANAIQPRYSATRDSSDFELGWELLRRRTTRRSGAVAAFPGAELGVRTAGLAISRDGRTIWAATEEGIFEIGLNFKSRSRWPAVDLR